MCVCVCVCVVTVAESNAETQLKRRSSLEKVHPAVNKEVSCGPGSLTYLLKMKQLIILEIYQFGVAKSKRRWRRFMQQATKVSAVASHE